MLEFSRKLRIFIADNNIRKKSFAIEIGVTPDTISNWLHGRVKKISRLNAMNVEVYTRGLITMEDMGF